MLLEKGYHQLSLRPLASAVGCSPTSLYLYFRNKDALIHTLIDEGMERLGAELRAARSAASDPREGLRALARRYLDFGLDNPEYYEIMFMLHSERMERYPPELYRRARRNLELFGETMAEALGAEAASHRDLSAASTLLWCMLHGTVALLIAQRVDVRISRTALVEEAVEQTLRMLDQPAETS